MARQTFHLIGDVRLVRIGDRLRHGSGAAEGERRRRRQQNEHKRTENVFAHGASQQHLRDLTRRAARAR